MGTELEVKDQGTNVLDKMPFNLTQLLAYAMQKPRNMEIAMQSAILQLRAAPEFAKRAYYSIPFKKSNGPDEIVEGPSIKAATALTGCWGNNIEGAFFGQETEDHVDVMGYFFDYETGKLTIRPWRVSKTYRERATGKTVPWRKDMLDKQIAAGVSKAIRNADLNGLPAGLVAEYFAEAKRIAARGGKLEPAKANLADDAKAIMEQMGQCIARLDGLGVKAEEVQDYIGRHPELQNEEQVCAHLIGLLNGLDDGQISIEDAFSAPTKPISEPQRASAPVPAAATPAPATPPPAGKTLPKDRRRMQAKMSGTECGACKKKISAGQWIWRNPEANRWEHEVC